MYSEPVLNSSCIYNKIETSNINKQEILAGLEMMLTFLSRAKSPPPLPVSLEKRFFKNVADLQCYKEKEKKNYESAPFSKIPGLLTAILLKLKSFYFFTSQ